YRVTQYAQIERWWEIVSSAYLLVSLQFGGLSSDNNFSSDPLLEKFQEHSCWQRSSSWTSRLHNLRLVVQPYVCFCWLKAWLSIFELPELECGFSQLIAVLNQFEGWRKFNHFSPSRAFSSA
ncbi:MAG TPA: hypothetical protein VL134_02355, partial [Leptolyngbya sp.]|nr:hypothetical protein [Leptolyngbya sp.]